MTLEEAIWREEALAHSFKKMIKSMETPEQFEDMETEHKQMAEWLKELKAFRKTFQRVGEKLSEKGYTEDDLKKIYEEVNADADSD